MTTGQARFVVRGTIAPFHENHALVGQYTYLADGSDPKAPYVWDGDHRAVAFVDVQVAYDAGVAAQGPLFRMPDPSSIEVINTRDLPVNVRVR